MDAVKERLYQVFFGGSYRECWDSDYTLSIAYEGRRMVLARKKNELWVPVDGDAELCELLRSSNCPPLTRQYFQAAASISAAADLCVRRGLPLDHIWEFYHEEDNPLAAPELMRLLMDDGGLTLNEAYQVTARCCENLACFGAEVGQVYPLQPRTAHVISLLRGCWTSVLAVEHNVLEPTYRNPIGAVTEGTRVQFSLRKLGGRAERATLILTGDKFYRQYPMAEIGDRFTVGIKMPEEACALWYYFQIETTNGSHWFCADESGLRGKLYGYEAEGFRLTVYKKNFETPAWFRRRVMYQIFPDRFAFSDDDTAERGIAYHRGLGQTPELHASLDEPVRHTPRPFEKDYSPDDFYGGTLKGIEKKLPYLHELGIGVLYLNPIVEARSNHRYDTSDYRKVDPILGTNEDLSRLCRKAEELDIRIVLDGVFSHTGADSLYFNRFGSYPGKGAWQGKDSPYFSWYDFRHFPGEYRCWWGFKDLPEVDETNPKWQNFVITGRDSVVKTWLRRGAAGWRLDVADELPDEVLALIRRAAKEEKSDALVLGEVWEDAVIKESYGGRRNYALGYSLDSVMNYPLRKAILRFAHGWLDAYTLRDFLIGQQVNYPRPIYYSLMNLLGSHDVERLRSALAADSVIKDLSREDQLALSFSETKLEHAVILEKLCAAIQFAIPGVPSIYYGDEQGMCGVGDPFNRQTFREDRSDLHEFYAALAARRNASAALSTGEARFFAASGDLLLILRWISDGKDVFGLPAPNAAWLVAVNRSMNDVSFTVDCSAAGHGLYHGRIGPEEAKFIEL